MKRYEIAFPSVNTEAYAKRITALVREPERMTERTGAMLFTHGWGGNRIDYEEHMVFACEEFNLICISVEFRQSGFDFDPVAGRGAAVPYDASFYQMFDVLNGLRAVLDLRPGLDRGRLFHYGGSQGGHLALLSAIFAPRTFAFVFGTSPATHIDDTMVGWAGREFAPYEQSIRDVIEHADIIACPVLIEHGKDDNVLDWGHTRKLAEKLATLEKPVEVKYYDGGGHQLQPTTTRLGAFKERAPEPMRMLRRAGEDDFAAGRVVEIPCGERTLRIDWSKAAESVELFAWVEN